MTGDARGLPAGFRWGVATSSYQIEGAVDRDGRGPSIWDRFAHTPGAIHGGDHGDVACDHYHRLDEDLDLLAWLGVDAYRFSVAWPRVQPDGKRLEPRGLAFYERLVDGLVDRGISPVATLYHWDLPQALEDEGGWSSRSIVDRFVAYARVVVDTLGDRVAWWATLNEPWCSAFLGYHAGEHAPGVRNADRAVAAAHHLLLAHGRTTRRLREDGDPVVGLVLNPAPVRPAADTPEDVAAAHLVDGLRNRLWSDPVLHGRYPDDVLAAWEGRYDLDVIRAGDVEEIGARIDRLGVNYYEPIIAGAGGPRERAQPGPGLDGTHAVPPEADATAMGWRVDGSGLEEILLRLHGEGAPPLVVTENGAAYVDASDDGHPVDDPERIAYLQEHLEAAKRATDRGVDLREFHVWTLMDNFEWSHGYRYRFGLVHVDRATLTRTPKASAHWYRSLIADTPTPAPESFLR